MPGRAMLALLPYMQEFNIHKEKEKDHEDPQPDLLSQASSRIEQTAGAAVLAELCLELPLV